MQILLRLLPLSLTFLVIGCAHDSGDTDDDRDDDFLAGGKADGAVEEGSPQARGVLRVVNELSLEQLDVDVALDKRAATNIVAHRDSDPFDTLAELDAVPYVGPVAFGKLLAYADAHGYIVEGAGVATCGGVTFVGTPVCGNAHWDWQHPRPNGYDLNAAWSFGASDVWAIGGTGSVMHYDGTTWRAEQTPVCEKLTALWGTSSTDLWAVGASGRILHRTASGWSVIDAGTCEYLTAVWGTPGGEVWISGYGGTLLRGDAQGFTPLTFDPGVHFSSMWGFSDTDIWAVDGGGIYHWDGTSWSLAGQGHWNLNSIWGSDPDHLFVAGFVWDSNSTAAFTFSPATAATPKVTLLSGNRISTVRGTNASDVWIASSNNFWRYDGTSWKWTPAGSGNDINTLAVSGANDAWALGTLGARLHWDGTAWTDTTQAPRSQGGIWAIAADDVWIAKYRGIRHWDGTSWIDVPGVTGFFNGIWASGRNDVWAVGAFGKVMHFDGVAWTQVTLPVSPHWYSVGGTSGNDVWIGGHDGKLVHWNGSTWTSLAASGAVHGVLARTTTDVWFATTKGLVHYDGTTLASSGPLNTGTMYRVWGSAPNDIWAAGAGVYHYDGNIWTQMLPNAGSAAAYQGLWGTSSKDVWVAAGGAFGGRTAISHWDGESWTTHVDPTNQQLVGLAGAGGHVWAIDMLGGVLRYRE